MNFCMATSPDRRRTAALLLLWAVCTLLPLLLALTAPPPLAQNGVADLSAVDLSRGPARLSGTWAFFDGRQIVTELWQDPVPDAYVDIPSYQTGGGAPQRGSYRLYLDNCPPETQVVLTLRGMPAAYRIYLNGQPVERSGLVSGDSATARVSAGYRDEGSVTLRASRCELVVETAGYVLPGLSVAPGLMERDAFFSAYNRFCALSLLLFGMGVLIAAAYALDLFLTPRSGYSPALLLAMILLLFKGLSGHGVCAPLLGERLAGGYDGLLLLAQGAELAAWLLLLRLDYVGRRPRPGRGFSAALVWGGIGAAALSVLGLVRGSAHWWMAVGGVMWGLLTWRMLAFLRAPHRDGWTLEGGYLLLWMGCILDQMGYAGLLPQSAQLCFLLGLVLFSLSVNVVDRRRMDGIQSEALRAAQMEAQLQRARTDIALHQIKPHFLHNALMSIKVLCRTRPKEAEQAIYDFTIFLRGNMKALESPRPIPFPEEVEAIACYLRIEQIRFRQRLRVVWDLEEEDFSVPPLTIQPLVENAVRHGVCQKPEGGTVTIASRRTEEAILVEITDDGVGFDLSAVEQSGGIGIRNLRLRLKEQLGAVLDIQSAPGKGTVQTVRIPVRRMEDEDYIGGR